MTVKSERKPQTTVCLEIYLLPQRLSLRNKWEKKAQPR